jgi:hypothetical protein
MSPGRPDNRKVRLKRRLTLSEKQIPSTSNQFVEEASLSQL